MATGNDSLFSVHFKGLAHIKNINFMLKGKINHCDTKTEFAANSVHFAAVQVGHY